jgi:hypothetical protein
MGDQPNNVNLATLVVYVVRVEWGFASGDEGGGSRVFIVLEGGSGCGPLLLRFWREVVDSRSRCRGREAMSLQRKKKAPQSAASVLNSQQYLLCLLPFVVSRISLRSVSCSSFLRRIADFNADASPAQPHSSAVSNPIS